MAYIVATADMPDKKFDTYEEACACAQSMRRDGIEAVIVTSEDHWRLWSVCKTGMTRPQVVGARSADEAIMLASCITNDDSLNIVQRH